MALPTNEEIDMTDLIIDHAPALAEPTREELSIQINTLQREVERLTNNRNYHENLAVDLAQKIDNVRGIYSDLASEGEEITDTLREIARMLEISLTRDVSVSVTVTYSGTATVPIDMNVDDIANGLSFEFSEEWNTDIEWDISEDDVDWDIQED